MKSNRVIKVIATLVLILSLSISCEKDSVLQSTVDSAKDVVKVDSLKVTPSEADQVISRIYQIYALSGNEGPGSSHITAEDAGQAAFIRNLVNLQDFTADGIKNRWGNDGLNQLVTSSNWDANNMFFDYFYNRFYFVINQSTELIETFKRPSDTNLESRIIELRFLRALSYFYLIDGFGKGTLVTEENFKSTDPLPESSRLELFNYVESELLEIESNAPLTATYGRVNKQVIRMLIAKLYLNAEVYTNIARYPDALKYTQLIINEGGYTLDQDYVSIFSADNHLSNEVIFPLMADYQLKQSYGNTTYIINPNFSSLTMNPEDFGVNYGWDGHRSTKSWYGLYNDNGEINSIESLKTSSDERAKLFWTEGHTFEMTDYKEWTNGFPSTKFRNTNFHTPSQSIVSDFSSTDFPLYRLADVYLMYAECVLRGGGGDMTQAIQYVNDIRTRSKANSITSINLNFILDERARELNLEGHRRTDLIRFGKFTGASYVWPWKGGVSSGASIPSTYNLFPLPTNVLEANTNLTQNPGY